MGGAHHGSSKVVLPTDHYTRINWQQMVFSQCSVFLRYSHFLVLINFEVTRQALFATPPIMSSWLHPLTDITHTKNVPRSRPSGLYDSYVQLGLVGPVVYLGGGGGARGAEASPPRMHLPNLRLYLKEFQCYNNLVLTYLITSAIL